MTGEYKTTDEVSDKMKEAGAAVLANWIMSGPGIAWGRYDLVAWKVVADIYEAMKRAA